MYLGKESREGSLKTNKGGEKGRTILEKRGKKIQLLSLRRGKDRCRKAKDSPYENENLRQLTREKRQVTARRTSLKNAP